MSAAFKIAKKKITQNELRKYMNDHKIKDIKDVKKIQSPLAKYNENGQLTCILCQSIVRSEAVWSVHVNAKQHKQNVEQAKKLKERTNNFTTSLKRPLTPPLPDIPEKKVKGILKNGNKSSSVVSSSDKGNDSDKPTKKLPDDFFDSKNGLSVSISMRRKETVEKMDVSVEGIETENALPEGFFDDPKQDAKARNQEYKDPIEEEWDKFMKAIKEADNESNAIIAEDQEEATTERQIDEIDEQMKKLSKVLDLEKKKVEVISISSETKQFESNNDEDEVDIDEFDEFLDWREKKSFT